MQTVLTAYAEQGIKLTIESKPISISYQIDYETVYQLAQRVYPMRMDNTCWCNVENLASDAWAIDSAKKRKLKELKPKNLLYQYFSNNLANLIFESQNGFIFTKATGQLKAYC